MHAGALSRKTCEENEAWVGRQPLDYAQTSKFDHLSFNGKNV